MGKVLHYPSRHTDKALKAEVEAYCKPHGIDPKWVASITVNTVPEPTYQIEYYNPDGHYCTILVHEPSTEGHA
jgi:hypothetical protein